MRRHKRRELEVVSNMNLTSLLDVTFILLVCFMMVAPNLNSGLQLELSKVEESATKPLVTNNKPVMISIGNRTNKEREPIVTIDGKLAMPDANLHFPKAYTREYRRSWDGVRCAVMQGGQGDIKHWAFNDPVKRAGKFKDRPPTPAEYRQLATRVVDLHPITIAQNARTSGGGNITLVPTQALTVGPVETWQADKVSIWQAGNHDTPFGQRLTTLMIAKRIPDSAVPMSLLADHPNVQFNFYRPGIGSCAVEMH